MKEQTLRYKFKIAHCPGKLHLGADALSRYPVNNSSTDFAISSIVLQEASQQDVDLSYKRENAMNLSLTAAIQSINELGHDTNAFSAITIDMIENAGKSPTKQIC